MNNDNITTRDVITQPGGSIQIVYGGLMIMAPTNHVHQGIAYLKIHQAAGDKEQVMASVNHAIKKMFPKVKSGKASKKQAMDCCQDITIWFANEILEGNQTLEQKNLNFIQNQSLKEKI